MKRLLLPFIVIAVCVGFCLSAPPPGGIGGGSVAFRSNPPSDPPAPAGFPAGATHYWNLDEASGTRDDAIGSTDLDEVTAVASGTGKDSNAAQFDWNSTDFGRLEDGVNITIPSAYSLAAWFKFSSVAANQTLRVQGATVGDGFTFGLIISAATDQLSFAHQEEETLTVGFTPDTSWHLICATATGTTVTIYLDGSSVASNGSATIDFSDWDSFNINAENSGSMSGTVGLVDEVAFWTIALTPSDITTLWNGGTGTFGP